MLDLSAGRGTNNPLISNILIAKNINAILGGAFIAPWEVGELPDEWIDAMTAIAFDLPKYQGARKQVADYLSKWRDDFRKRQ